MTDKEFASNRTLVGILHTIIVGTSVLSLAAWWLHYAVVFYVCAGVCTLLTLGVPSSWLTSPQTGHDACAKCLEHWLYPMLRTGPC